jgi:hypothetical protein
LYASNTAADFAYVVAVYVARTLEKRRKTESPIFELKEVAAFGDNR